MKSDYYLDSRLSASDYKQAIKSKAHYAKSKADGFKPSDAMILGTAVHCAVLEPERFATEFSLEQEFYKRSGNGFVAGDPKLDEDGKPKYSLVTPDGVLTGDKVHLFLEMKEALLNNEMTGKILEGATIEQEFYTETERCKPDIITANGFIVDLKTVGGLSDMPLEDENFAREFWGNGYDIQMFVYRKILQEKGYDIKGFAFLCVDKKSPCGVRLFSFKNDDDWFKYASQRYNVAKKRIEEIKAGGEALKYEEAVCYDLPLPFNAVNWLSKDENDDCLH